MGRGVRTCKAFNLLPGGHTYRFPNAVNVFLTARRIRRLARSLPRPFVLWIYDPCMAGTVGSCGEAFAVYDCIDDYSALTFYGARERSLVAHADERSARVAKVVATTTRALYERHSARNAETYLVPNVGDFEHFNPASQRGVRGPGVARRQKTDHRLLREPHAGKSRFRAARDACQDAARLDASPRRAHRRSERTKRAFGA